MFHSTAKIRPWRQSEFWLKIQKNWPVHWNTSWLCMYIATLLHCGWIRCIERFGPRLRAKCKRLSLLLLSGRDKKSHLGSCQSPEHITHQPPEIRAGTARHSASTRGRTRTVNNGHPVTQRHGHACLNTHKNIQKKNDIDLWRVEHKNVLRSIIDVSNQCSDAWKSLARNQSTSKRPCFCTPSCISRQPYALQWLLRSGY